MKKLLNLIFLAVTYLLVGLFGLSSLVLFFSDEPFAGGTSLFIAGVLFLFTRNNKNKSANPEVENITIVKDEGMSSSVVDFEEFWQEVKGNHKVWEGQLGEWYFKAPTDSQIEKLRSLGHSPNDRMKKQLTRGMVSDLIGMHYEPDETDLSKLKILNVKPRSGLKQTQVRILVHKLMLNPENRALWDNRPADKMTVEKLKFFGVEVPRGLSVPDSLMMLKEATYSESMEEDWSSFESIWDDLSDKDTREDYDLKKVSLQGFKKAIDSLSSEGISLQDMEGDLSIVSEKIIEMYPNLERL